MIWRSNESSTRRARETYERIINSAANAAAAWRTVASASMCPPINSYYRRLVHELAEEHGLAHESIKGVGMLYKDDTKTFKHCFTGEFVSSHSAFEIEAKAVLITKPGLDAKVKELLLTEAREVAAAREPSQGGAIGRGEGG